MVGAVSSLQLSKVDLRSRRSDLFRNAGGKRFPALHPISMQCSIPRFAATPARPWRQAPVGQPCRHSAARCRAATIDKPGPSKDWHETELRHVVEAQQFSKKSLEVVFNEAIKMEKIRPGTPDADVLRGYIMATLFYEPSTRTRLSFESAMSRLGGTVLTTESAGEYSSAAKGETLEGECAAAEPERHSYY